MEVAELVEHFQWLTEEQSRSLSEDQLREVAEEIGDVLIYLDRLADQLALDPVAEAHRKMEINAKKYPVEEALLEDQMRLRSHCLQL